MVVAGWVMFAQEKARSEAGLIPLGSMVIGMLPIFNSAVGMRKKYRAIAP